MSYVWYEDRNIRGTKLLNWQTLKIWRFLILYFLSTSPPCLTHGSSLHSPLSLPSLLYFSSSHLSSVLISTFFVRVSFSPPLPSHLLTPALLFRSFFSLSCSLHLSLAAVAGGGTTVRRGTATDGTNTRRARGARRAKRPARRSAQTKRIRKPWSSDDHFPSFIPSFVSMLTRKGENERETKKTRKWLSDRWTCHSPLHQSPFSSTLLSFTLTITSE